VMTLPVILIRFWPSNLEKKPSEKTRRKEKGVK
jgi:hypothetical protein